VIVLAEKNDHKTLIDEENNARSVNHSLPGFQPMPNIQFSLSDPNLPVLVDLEIGFDIQLECDSLIQFSPEPNPQNLVLVITLQWKVQPL
jgi:hypothetical protein